MLGPIMGPTVGGWLTETYSWRWVFYINLPFGLLAAAGLMIFLPSGGEQRRLRFDWLGFSCIHTRCAMTPITNARATMAPATMPERATAPATNSAIVMAAMDAQRSARSRLTIARLPYPATPP
jgi:MFS family permease